MDPILDSVYGAILPSAPYVIAAYALIWVALCVFVAVIAARVRKGRRDLELLERQVERLREEKGNREPRG